MSDDFVLLGGNGDCLKPWERYFDFGIEGGNKTNSQARKIIPPSANNKPMIRISIIFTLPFDHGTPFPDFSPHLGWRSNE